MRITDSSRSRIVRLLLLAGLSACAGSKGDEPAAPRDTADTASLDDSSDTTDTSPVDTSDTSLPDTSDSGDTAQVDTSDTSSADTSDSGDTADTAAPTTAPVARVLTPATGDTVRVGTTLHLEGTAADAEDATPDLQGRWVVDGVEACAPGAPDASGIFACEADVATTGPLEIVFEVTDPAGATGSDTVTVEVVPDEVPDVAILAPTASDALRADEDVDLRGAVADLEDAPERLTAWWEVDGVALVGPDAVPAVDGTLAGTTRFMEGTHALALHVVDTGGNEAVSTLTLDVAPANRAPSCAFLVPASGSVFATGSVLALAGTVSDPDQDVTTLDVRWTDDRDGFVGTSVPAADGSVTLDRAGLAAGSHHLTLVVTDDRGLVCEVAADVTIDTPPTLTVELPLDGERANEGESVRFLASVSDAEDAPDALDVRWESDLDGILLDALADADGASSFASETLSTGTHALTVSVTDTLGLTTSTSLEIVVNGLPTTPVVSIAPARPNADDDLVAHLDVPSVDPDSDVVSYTWLWRRDGIVSTASTGDILPAVATAPGDVWTVEVVADDGWGESLGASASVRVEDRFPTLTHVALTPDPARTDDTLICGASGARDADGESVALAYVWTRDGASLAATGSTLDGSWFAKGDAVACRVTPSAGSGTGATVTSNVVTIANSAPSLTRAELGPSTPQTGEALRCSALGWSDADGDADASTTGWTVNGVTVATTGSALAGGFVGGDTVTCVVTPFDGTDTGTPVSATVTVLNTPPVLASVSLTPATAREGNTLTCAPGPTSDADGTTTFNYTTTWTVNGAALPVTASTLTGADFDADDVVACSVTPNDGTVDGAAVSSGSVTIANTEPVVTSVTLAPSSPRTNDTLVAAAGGSDTDGDSVAFRYAWYVNGGLVSGVTGASLPGTLWFARGDSVEVRVTPDDGRDLGAAVPSSAVTVANSAPTAPAAGLVPVSPLDGQALTCSVATAATDADGDALTYTFAWTLDGAPVSGMSAPRSSTIAAGTTLDGEVWACTVTVSDGVATASSSTVSSTIARSCNTGLVSTAAGVDFVEVCGETTTLGCTASAAPCSGYDPRRTVTLGHDFLVSTTEITRTQFQTRMGFDPSASVGCTGACPVNQVTWHLAAAYANALSLANGLASCYSCSGSGSGIRCTSPADVQTCAGFRLLTDAEWETAARCEEDTTYAGGSVLSAVGWYNANSGAVAHPVGGKAPNACGLHDMSGNAWEWINDFWDPAPTSGTTDPTGPATEARDWRMTRGGTWAYGTSYTRVADRNPNTSTDAFNFLGIRIGRTAPVVVGSGTSGDTCSAQLHDGGLYTFCTTPRNWATAEAGCVERGGHLASVADSAEHDWINTVRGELGTVGSYAWIGFRDAAVEGTWTWADGSAVTFTGWSGGEPNNGLGTVEEDCAAFRNDLGGWYDASCVNTNPYICEAR